MKQSITWNLTRIERRMLFRVAHEANTVTGYVKAGASCVSEICEALIFLNYFPPGSKQHKQFCTHLQTPTPQESITDCIKRIAPDFYNESQESLMDEALGRTKYDEVADQVWEMLAHYGIRTEFVQ